jgi:HTH-type transcriptional regulator/antitoxin MqsA
MKTINCPICSSGVLSVHFSADQIQYKGLTLCVNVEYAICAQCGEEMILPEQIKRNDCLIRDAWRKADGLLTGAEIVTLRQKLDLTQQQAAQIFGGGVNAFSKYERNEVIQSEAMDKLMRLAQEKSDVFEWLKIHVASGQRLSSSSPDSLEVTDNPMMSNTTANHQSERLMRSA